MDSAKGRAIPADLRKEWYVYECVKDEGLNRDFECLCLEAARQPNSGLFPTTLRVCRQLD